jgi:fructose-1,6-bisphosphatase/inositol monophosphatase family enzyme
VIDPIDGTNNLVRGFPFVCVSIGLLVGSKPVLGVVYASMLDLLFTATLGGGAYLDGHRIRTSGCVSLDAAAIAKELGYDRSPEGKVLLQRRVGNLSDASLQSLRMTGSCALNMCHVACGRLDGYYEGRNRTFGPKAWDVAASTVIVEEAGGCLSTPLGGPADMFSGHVACAASRQLHVQLIETLNK